VKRLLLIPLAVLLIACVRNNTPPPDRLDVLEERLDAMQRDVDMILEMCGEVE